LAWVKKKNSPSSLLTGSRNICNSRLISFSIACLILSIVLLLPNRFLGSFICEWRVWLLSTESHVFTFFGDEHHHFGSIHTWWLNWLEPQTRNSSSTSPEVAGSSPTMGRSVRLRDRAGHQTMVWMVQGLPW
jgi:hypothetical protein